MSKDKSKDQLCTYIVRLENLTGHYSPSEYRAELSKQTNKFLSNFREKIKESGLDFNVDDERNFQLHSLWGGIVYAKPEIAQKIIDLIAEIPEVASVSSGDRTAEVLASREKGDRSRTR